MFVQKAAKALLVEGKVITREGQKIGVVQLNNGKNNELATPLRKSLIDHIHFLEHKNCKAIVIAGNDKVFSTGLELASLSTGVWSFTPDLGDVVTAISKSTLPTIAAVSGLAFGGGMEIALACNYRIGNKTTKMSLPELKFGLMPGAQGTQRLPRVVGHKRALEMILSGSTVKGEEAYELGLLDQFVGEDVEEDVFESSLLLADKFKAKDWHPMLCKLDPATALSVDEVKEVLAQFPLVSETNKKAVSKVLEAATFMDFDRGVEFEKILFRELLIANQKEGVLSFSSSTPAHKEVASASIS